MTFTRYPPNGYISFLNVTLTGIRRIELKLKTWGYFKRDSYKILTPTEKR